MSATKKRDELVKEREELEKFLLNQAGRFFSPIVNYISGMQRHAYVVNEINKITPRVQLAEEPKQPEAEEPEEEITIPRQEIETPTMHHGV